MKPYQKELFKILGLINQYGLLQHELSDFTYERNCIIEAIEELIQNNPSLQESPQLIAYIFDYFNQVEELGLKKSIEETSKPCPMLSKFLNQNLTLDANARNSIEHELMLLHFEFQLESFQDECDAKAKLPVNVARIFPNPSTAIRRMFSPDVIGIAHEIQKDVFTHAGEEYQMKIKECINTSKNSHGYYQDSHLVLFNQLKDNLLYKDNVEKHKLVLQAHNKGMNTEKASNNKTVEENTATLPEDMRKEVFRHVYGYGKLKKG